MIGSTLAHTTIVGLVTLVPLLYLAEELPTPPDVLAFVVPVLHRRRLRLLRSARASPEYPQIAISAKKEGIVILEATVNADGLVSHVRVLRSEPLLDKAAVDAVKQWRFSPLQLNGRAQPFILSVTVSFNL